MIRVKWETSDDSLLTIARHKDFTVTIYQIENMQSSHILFRVKHSEGIEDIT